MLLVLQVPLITIHFFNFVVLFFCLLDSWKWPTTSCHMHLSDGDSEALSLQILTGPTQSKCLHQPECAHIPEETIIPVSSKYQCRIHMAWTVRHIYCDAQFILLPNKNFYISFLLLSSIGQEHQEKHWIYWKVKQLHQFHPNAKWLCFYLRSSSCP